MTMARPPKKKQNPIHAAVSSWLDSLPPTFFASASDQINPSPNLNDTKQRLLDRSPKRWVVYEPMVLLPSGSFASAPWPALLGCLTALQKEALWTAILVHLCPPSKPRLTNLAINEGIPLHLAAATDPSSQPADGIPRDSGKEENVLRSPTTLRPLHGDFGPPPSLSPDPPSQADLDASFWVSTTQNGILQTWSPLHTMFSRGNIKEKARLLAFHSPPVAAPCSFTPAPRRQPEAGASSPSPGPRTKPQPHPRANPSGLAGKWAVDLYAGIGYFAFSFARLGLRVLCWELNPWSVEGLRRGARANGFSVRVVYSSAAADVDDDDQGQGQGAVVDLADVVQRGNEQIVVFLEDNRHAARRIAAARAKGAEIEVVHVNCGFLPSSEPVWRDAGQIVRRNGPGREDTAASWLHLHENVGVVDIEGRRAEVQRLFGLWIGGKRPDGEEEEGKEDVRLAEVEHVELVKTYAPGVWHCVFDVCITRSSADAVE